MCFFVSFHEFSGKFSGAHDNQNLWVPCMGRPDMNYNYVTTEIKTHKGLKQQTKQQQQKTAYFNETVDWSSH